MQLTELWEVFLVGMLGAVIAETLHWWTLFRKEPAAFPRYLRQPWYWITTVIVTIGAAAVALLQLGVPVNAMAPVEFGLGGPLLLHKLASGMAVSAHRDQQSDWVAYLAG